MTAHVNELGIILRFAGPWDNLSPENWQRLLDELKSQPLPGFYPAGKRMRVDIGPNGMRGMIQFTDDTVTIDEAIAILKRWKIDVYDVRDEGLAGSSPDS